MTRARDGRGPVRARGGPAAGSRTRARPAARRRATRRRRGRALRRFWLLDAPDGGLAGLAGTERYGAAWRLRSLAVHPVFQGRGHGTGLLTSVLAEARRAGVDDVFLLTTYAQRFFAAHGFREVPRTTAPAALRSSAELQGACPDSATLMRLELSP